MQVQTRNVNKEEQKGEQKIELQETQNSDWDTMKGWVHTAFSTCACVHTFLCKIGFLTYFLPSQGI